MTVRWAKLLLVVTAVALVAGLGSSAAGERDTAGTAAFLKRHWRQPLAPQGRAPAHFSPLERSLAPESCGACHPAQLTDWKTTRHARSMGPGVTGQLPDMWHSDPDSARLCLTCHAPLAEQAPEAKDFDAALQTKGLVCAACHVRGHERFGPPRRDGAMASPAPRETLPHNGVTRAPAFLAAEFCSVCHQFKADGLALNGKLLENTHAEWTTSPAARSGRQCQDCHMPDRRHLWRGIHDREMVASGVRIRLDTDRPRYQRGDEVRATLVVTSVGVGHFFPTYVTPRVLVRLALVDGAGRPVAGSLDEHVIGREVTPDLSREVVDTRIPPGGRASFTYRRRLDRVGLSLVATVRVEPDHFYTRLFESLLASGMQAGSRDIRMALDASRRSSFEIFTRTLPLT